MELSEFQKQVVGTILTGETCHIETFFDRYCDFEEVTPTDRNWTWHEYSRRTVAPIGNRQMCLVRNPDEAHHQLREFISLWQVLEETRLVLSIPYHKTSLHPVYHEQAPQDYQVLRRLAVLFAEYDQKEIVPLPSLQEFVSSGYRTKEEIAQEKAKALLEEEVADRKASQSLTKKIAYISMFASVASVVVGGAFNYFTYKTDRTVTITNSNAFPDTAKVYIVNPTETERDTALAVGREEASSSSLP